MARLESSSTVPSSPSPTPSSGDAEGSFQSNVWAGETEEKQRAARKPNLRRRTEEEEAAAAEKEESERETRVPVRERVERLEKTERVWSWS